MKRKVVLVAVLGMVLLSFLVVAHTQEDLEEAEQLILAEVPCSELTEDQLDHIGDYYMEQMHPGEAHEIMDARMGGEGSESLRQAHIAMAYRFYCDGYGPTDETSFYRGGMMGYAMSPGMMSGWGQGMHYGYGWLNAVLWVLLIIGAIVTVVMLLRHRRGGALEVLEKRYAKGELSKKQFEEMKRDLRK